MNSWLVTGGCGFIGRSLIHSLLQSGVSSIRVVDNLCEGKLEDLEKIAGDLNTKERTTDFKQPNGVEFVKADVLDADLAKRVVSGCSTVVHLAANTGVAPSVQNPRADMQTNVIGTFNYLEASRDAKVQRFVFASSGAPIGEANPPIHEKLPANPVSPYGASKLAGEGYCSAFYRTFGLETVALRFGNVYGPRSDLKSSVVAKFIKQALDEETLEIFGDGNQTRDFIFIDDLIDAIRRSADQANIGGNIFQIATGVETTINEATQLLLKELNDRGLNKTKVVNTDSRLGDVNRNFSDISKALTMLGWTPKTPLRDGMNATIDYFLAERASTK